MHAIAALMKMEAEIHQLSLKINERSSPKMQITYSFAANRSFFHSISPEENILYDYFLRPPRAV